MKIFGLHIITSAQFAAMKNSVRDFALQEVDEVVAALKATEIGGVVAGNIRAVASQDMSGAEKFDAVLKNTMPLVLGYARAGGVNAVRDDVEDIARQLVQSVFNDVASTSVGRVIAALLKVLGLR